MGRMKYRSGDYLRESDRSGKVYYFSQMVKEEYTGLWVGRDEVMDYPPCLRPYEAIREKPRKLNIRHQDEMESLPSGEFLSTEQWRFIIAEDGSLLELE